MPKTIMLVGCRNRAAAPGDIANGQGIAAFDFDKGPGRLEPMETTTGIDNPTFLAVSPEGRNLYATSEVVDWNEGTVSAYEIASASGILSYLNKQPSRGSLPAQLSLDATGRYILTINYSAGSMSQRPNRSLVVYPRAANGELGAPVAEVSHHGHGTDPVRQDRPHPHCARVTPDNRFVVVSDLGLDRLMVYSFDVATGKIGSHGEMAMPPGSGPRHFVFHPTLPVAYVANELSSTVASLAFDAGSGRFRLLSTEPTVPPAAAPINSCSEIAIDPSGGHLYVGNRGHDSLACLRIDPSTGLASLVRTTPSGGKTPRHFAFDPTGAFIAVANQDSDGIAVFSVDRETGSLSQLPGLTMTGTPTCVAFATV